jgi:CRISPR/Cas system CSM-associated protein Csm3 (group 7 of RAMP superfamily)
MKTYIIEAKVTALSSISHNGGETNGVVTQLRREKFVQPNGHVVEIPVISGNSTRGKMRDISAVDILTKENGEKIKLDAEAFNLLFSGGSLESEGNKPLNLEKVRQMRKDMPGLSVFGCSIGNIILPGKVQVGKMMPICKENEHMIPDNFKEGLEIKSIWDLCQLEMYTRKDDMKDENYREYLTDAAKEGEKIKSQMQYHTETIAAGTVFYWKICMIDTDDMERGAFLSVLQKFANTPFVLGGNGRVGLGDIKIEILSTNTIDSDVDFKNDDFVQYVETYQSNKKNVSDYFESGGVNELLS